MTKYSTGFTNTSNGGGVTGHTEDAEFIQLFNILLIEIILAYLDGIK